MKINDKRKAPVPLKFSVLNRGTTFTYNSTLFMKITNTGAVYLHNGETATFVHDDLCMVVECEINIVK